MDYDGFWKVFEETGDPMCWLMYSAEKRFIEIESKNAVETLPDVVQFTGSLE